MGKSQEALTANLLLCKNSPRVCPMKSENIMKFWKEINFKFLLNKKKCTVPFCMQWIAGRIQISQEVATC